MQHAQRHSTHQETATQGGSGHPELRSYAMLAKPVSDACNLRCSYCYYIDKAKVLNTQVTRMSPSVLEAYIRQSFAMHGKDAVVDFAWHGGEPLLAGLDFYHHVVRLQKEYGQGRHILNTLQTNGTGITDAWCHFFKDAGFLLGVSLDGPENMHNAYRKTAQGKGSFAQTMRGIELLQKHGIPFNTLTTVNRVNMDHAHEVYHFLQGLTDHMQFLPIVEFLPTASDLNMPSGVHGARSESVLAPHSATPDGFGRFLCTLWDTWQAHESKTKHIQLFDVILAALEGIPSTLCMHSALCGHSGCVEANGDIYSCDRYAFPAYTLGNLMDTSLGNIMEGNRAFGMHKTYGLAPACFECPYVTLCFGGCPKERLGNGRNYLCAGYQAFFAKVVASCVDIKSV